MKNLLLWFWSWINPLWLPQTIYNYYKYSKIVGNALKEQTSIQLLAELASVHNIQLRQDFLNRLYTVVNLEPYIYKNPDMSILFVLETVKLIDASLLKMNLSDVVTATIYRQGNPDKNEFYYLIIVSPNVDTIGWFDIIIEILKIVVYYYLITYLFNLVF